MNIHELVARFIFRVVQEFRVLDMEQEPETKTTPTGFVIPKRRIGS